jgi:hypothetical protein
MLLLLRRWREWRVRYDRIVVVSAVRVLPFERSTERIHLGYISNPTNKRGREQLHNYENRINGGTD